MLERLHFSRRQKQSNFVVIGALRVIRAKQLNRRRQRRPALLLVCPVNVRRKNLSLTCLQTHWNNTIAHWSGPPRTYVDLSQDQQGRLVYVKTAVAATCIKILSQVAQCNDDLIASSVLLSVIYFGSVFTIQPCLK